MIPAAFEYSRANSVDEALGLLSQHAGSAKIIAGGHSLLPLLKLRVASVERLIDIGKVSELRGIRAGSGGGLTLGALTTYRDILESADVRSGYQVLIDVVDGIGDVQVRNRGTVGGAIAHADPASDLPAALLALDADIVVRSQAGERVIPVVAVLRGRVRHRHRRERAAHRDPHPVPGGPWRRRTPSSSSRRPAIRSSASPRSSADPVARAVPHVRVGITGVGDVAYRASGVEQALADRDFSPNSPPWRCRPCGRRPDGRLRHPRRPRRIGTQMAAVFTRRALEEALRRAG